MPIAFSLFRHPSHTMLAAPQGAACPWDTHVVTFMLAVFITAQESVSVCLNIGNNAALGPYS